MKRALCVLVLAALLPVAARAEGFECPPEGRLAATKAPSDYPAGPDARCVAGGLVYFYGPDGKPLPQMTSLAPGWYFSAAGYAQADAMFRKRGQERDAAEEKARAVSSACGQQPETCGTVPPAEVKNTGSVTAVLVALGVGLLAGAAGGAYLTARALR